LIVEGILEISDKGHGFLRPPSQYYKHTAKDPFVSRNLINKFSLRNGMAIRGEYKKTRGQNPQVSDLISLNDCTPDEYIDVQDFEDLVAVDPNQQIVLETGAEPLGMRVIDLLTPIGKGQRGLLVAPPRTGKTVLLKEIANAITVNHPEIELMMLLVDERPEEVTDMRRSTEADVIASSNDKDIETHVRTAMLALDQAKRLVECGKDVVILLDSITRLGRAFNSYTRSSGRTLSGGLDIQGLKFPKKFFGSARLNETGGSLTILATALVETGSRMDDVIFQEFKGTGNMELVLDQTLSNKRIYPAINIPESGTRKEELLLDKGDLEKLHRLRRFLDGVPVGQDVQTLISALKKHDSNKSFLAELP
jgi:transcription termination factor Rho